MVLRYNCFYESFAQVLGTKLSRNSIKYVLPDFDHDCRFVKSDLFFNVYNVEKKLELNILSPNSIVIIKYYYK